MASKHQMPITTPPRRLPDELPIGALAAMKGAHAAKLKLCDTLELIADSLPGHIDRRICEVTARQLEDQIARYHAFEENIVFPVYKSVSGDAFAGRTIDRLCFEHREDEDFAFELAEQLLSTARGSAGNWETLGFMLRGFFNSVRRHVAFEQEHVLARLELRDSETSNIVQSRAGLP